ncbi:TetR/AcrR family transcriptional regulator C-terminal domain-containing protein [Kibdelosporangium philippinense]|uniref:TetR/AcrR family transcriptional regulator C-terminal domain-containing protein n=1 Tax=Kibdelosporangium philippinense TaxID=211113 RepID=A0ABS8ZTB2_9PSEU|nr:TetR/AcrR family transcriptional regulator C-terminal domain-containing protein [Kibdelosporangium philippinense]MCE7010837.1 TetR/AcrR family transcriptional regulator C-terminal domain-containing protein [Kibdelosporangium philippinense]
MSLYYHFRNKDVLLDGMVDLVFSEIELPPVDADWQPAMRRRAVSMRDALNRHPWAVSLMDSRTTPGHASLRHRDAVIGCLRSGGFSIAGAAHAVSLLAVQVTGRVRGGGWRDPGPAGCRGVPAHLAEMITERAGHAYTEEFEIGLDVILDGLRRWA